MCGQLLLMLWLVCAPFRLPALQDTYLRFLNIASSFYQEQMSGLQRRLEFTLPELLDPTRKHSSQVQLLGYAVGNHPCGLACQTGLSQRGGCIAEMAWDAVVRTCAIWGQGKLAIVV